MKKKILTALSLSLVVLCFASCGKKGESEPETVSHNVTTTVTNLDTTPPSTGNVGGVSSNTSFDQAVDNISGRSAAAEAKNSEPKEVNSNWTSKNRCDQFVIDGIVFDYGMTITEFNNVMKASPHADEYQFAIKPNQLCACYTDRPTEVYVSVLKGEELWFYAIFTYPPCDDDAVSIEKTCLAAIEPQSAALGGASWGKNMSYKEITKVTYNNFEEFLWQNVVSHPADWEPLPVVTLENGEKYEAKGQSFHYHTYDKEETDEDGNVSVTTVREEEPCDIKDGKCTKCGYEVPNVQYDTKMDSWNNTITVTYTHTGSKVYVRKSSWSGFALYVPAEYDVTLTFSTETRELVDFKFSAPYEASWKIPEN